MINNVVIVSGVQQIDSVIHTHVSILFQILSHLDCDLIFAKLSFVCVSVCAHACSTSYTVISTTFPFFWPRLAACGILIP